MKMKVLCGVLLIFLTIGSGGGKAFAEESQYFEFVKKSLHEWEYNEYEGLRNYLINPPNKDLVEYKVFEYELFTSSNRKVERLEGLRAKVLEYYKEGIYGDIAKDTLIGYIKVREQLLALGVPGDEELPTYDESATLDDYILSGKVDIRNFDVTIEQVLIAFLMREDVLVDLVRAGEEILNSDLGVGLSDERIIVANDETAKLPQKADEITRLILVRHILERYLKVEIRAKHDVRFVRIEIDIPFTDGYTVLYGSKNIEYMDKAYKMGIDPISKKKVVKMIRLAPGWLMKRFYLDKKE